MRELENSKARARQFFFLIETRILGFCNFLSLNFQFNAIVIATGILFKLTDRLEKNVPQPTFDFHLNTIKILELPLDKSLRLLI